MSKKLVLVVGAESLAHGIDGHLSYVDANGFDSSQFEVVGVADLHAAEQMVGEACFVLAYMLSKYLSGGGSNSVSPAAAFAEKAAAANTGLLWCSSGTEDLFRGFEFEGNFVEANDAGDALAERLVGLQE